MVMYTFKDLHSAKMSSICGGYCGVSRGNTMRMEAFFSMNRGRKAAFMRAGICCFKLPESKFVTWGLQRTAITTHFTGRRWKISAYVLPSQGQAFPEWAST